MKKFFLILLTIFFLSSLMKVDLILAQENQIEIYFFYSTICSHCTKEKVFLEGLEKKYSEIEIKKLGLFEKENVELLREFYLRHKVPSEIQGYVPITFIEEHYFLGYGSDETTGKEIENYVWALIKEEKTEGIQPFLERPSEELVTPLSLEKKIKIPVFGEVDISKFSPLALAITLGVLDGFNACAMIALGFLLAVLIATGIRKRVLLIGGTFILVSGIVYFLFISAWLNLFLALEQTRLITFLIGAIIISFAIFLLRDYFHGVVCKLCEVRPGKENILVRFEKKLFEKMEKFSTAEMSLPLILLGVAGVAGGVNLVELVCSFGFPVAFTKILTSFNLPTISYYFYLLIYILFYMLDDFLIFTFAVLTLRITQASQKYLKAIKLISGLLLLILGLIMLFKPEILMF